MLVNITAQRDGPVASCSPWPLVRTVALSSATILPDGDAHMTQGVCVYIEVALFLQQVAVQPLPKHPRAAMWLPSGALLLVPQANEPIVLVGCAQEPSAQGPRSLHVSQTLGSWLPVRDAASADLAGLSQPQARTAPPAMKMHSKAPQCRRPSNPPH
jgi:hypothetical protein